MQQRGEMRNVRPQDSPSDQYSLTLVVFFYLLTLLGKGIATALKAGGLFLLKTVVQHQVMMVGRAPRGAAVVLLEGQVMVPLKSIAKFP